MRAAFGAVLAASAAIVVLVASCAGSGEWEDREVLDGIQSTGPSPAEGHEDLREVGVVLPLTGRLSVYGKAIRDGLNLAYFKWCEGEARLVVLDTKGTPEGTREAFSTLVGRGSVLAVVGPCASSNARVAAEEAERSGLPLILPAATAYELTSHRKWVFRVCFTDPLQGAALAILARRMLKVSSAGVVAVPGDTYSLSLAAAFEKAFSGMGGEIPFHGSFGPGLDPVPVVKALRSLAAPPQALFIPAYAEESARLMVEVRKSGYEGKFLGGDGWHTEQLVAGGGKAVEGCHFTTHFVAGDPSPASKRFVAYFTETHGRPPGAFEALGYDAGLASIRALRNARSRDRKSVRDAVAGLVDLPGATGSITIDEFGNPVKNAVVAVVEKGKIAFARRIRFQPGKR